jgi:hypothetical protein
MLFAASALASLIMNHCFVSKHAKRHFLALRSPRSFADFSHYKKSAVTFGRSSRYQRSCRRSEKSRDACALSICGCVCGCK